MPSLRWQPLFLLYCSFVGAADECTSFNTVCSTSGQTCVDPDPNVANDWTCECQGSATGTQVGAAATCVYQGECQTVNFFCQQKNSACLDPDPTAATTGDWYCICPEPKRTITPGSTTVAAVCELDECRLTANYDTCHAVGQSCNDPGLDPKSLNDWTCNCVGMAGTQVVGPATCTAANECVANEATCLAQGQACSDASMAAGDWQCVCVAPETGTAGTAGLATCVLDECTVVCPSCAFDGATDSCQAAGSACTDPNTSPSSLNDWSCVLDECLVQAAVCGMTQACNDPNQSPTVTGDWVCNCIDPQVGTQLAAAATCVQDECTEAAKAGICSNAGQKCTDPDTSPTSVLDYTCNCVVPTTGTPVAAGPATCVGNAPCGTANVAICSNAGQACAPGPMGFLCVCLSPSTGPTGDAQPAVCVLDECAVICPTCADRGSGNQCGAVTCVDPDTADSSKGDWYCEVDECVAQAAVCTAAGQTCSDPNKASTSTNDWQCLCAGGTGAATAAVATCVVDECAAMPAPCTGQTCTDPDQSVTGDWTCTCIAPLTGTAKAMLATCVTDECDANGATCTAQGQTCLDPDTSQGSAGDWTCNCVAPATGTAAVAGVAMCTNTGECVANEATCIAAMQSCNDPDPAVMGDWQCVCLAPATGSATAGVATCTTDECVGNTECANAGQDCLDPDLAKVDDWECRCSSPKSGSAVKAVATCEVDECVTNGVVCTGVGQTCRDTDQTTLSNWECVCPVGQSGSAPLAVATCTLDECDANKATCENAGQTCNDPDTALAVLGDWTCNCVAPATGTATAVVATCIEQGECVMNTVCSDMGQSCSDPDTNVAGDWVCNCIAPKTGTTTGAPAVCVWDECATVTACPGPEQVCKDMDTATADSWQCECVAPLTGSNALGAAVCGQDECLAHSTTCVMPEQTCRDPDATTADDWLCECNAPGIGTNTRGPATCVLDECLTNAMTCSAQGQQCTDPNTATGSTSDWMCNCIAPSTGTAVQGAPATCSSVGECVANDATCIAAGQACEDPDLAVTGDWRCNCIAPATGTGVMTAAVCTLDECVANAATCPMGQTCTDPDLTNPSDWTCLCDAPTTGTGTMAAATCAQDECVANAALCTAQGQSCNDPNPTPASTGDWTCNCIAPSTGAAGVASVAMCTNTGECVANDIICNQAGQSCEDPDPAVMGDWKCNCIAPSTGSALMIAATCALDECVANAVTCTAQGQSCNDPNPTPASTGDWTCNCIAPSMGTAAVAGVAMCTNTGECVANEATCIAAGQSCEDPDPAVMGDWKCNCIAPSLGASVMMAASCAIDECLANGATCTAQGQSCTDPVQLTASLGDWTCNCVAPSTGTPAQGQPAMCANTGECVANEATCIAAGQSCEDPDQAIVGDWKCNCIAPATGSGVMMAATCVQDECVANDATCAAQGQSCNDPNPTPASTGDWTCNCIAPSTGTAVQAGVAMCTNTGECVANEATCQAAGQSCEDPDPAVMGDWKCNCIAPSTGSGVMMAATCSLDECVDNGATCTIQGQSCSDPNQMALADWTCNCIAPSTGAAVTASAATCTNTGECVANEATCIAAGQSCEDPDPAVMGDWKCNCIAPSTGSGVMMAAACARDECVDNGATCTAQGQSCNDPNPTPASTGDWTCNCIAPSTGAAVTAGVAMCTNTGECVANEATCIAAGQSCEDPDPAVMGDWKCNCIAPATGSGVMMAATCSQDECIDNGATCTSQGQSCNDPNPTPASTGDWTCNCIAPSTGAATVAGAAPCTNTGECIANEATCIAAGQSCEDPDPAVMGDWKCNCIAPATGSGVMMAATCARDECVDNGATCTAQGQSCNDPNPTPASTGDWTCNCIAPSTGTAVQGGVAMCTNTGECVVNEPTCQAAGQSCEDPDPAVMGDWKCNCIAPLTGSGVSMAAICTLDECVDNGATCTAQGQSCNDPNTSPTVTKDWTCNCIAPSTGIAVQAGVATCTNVGECVLNEAICIAAGQSCQDPDQTVMGDWKCNCIAPSTGSSVMMAATCTLDECVDNGATCTAKGQSCNDPNPTSASTGDWTCNCIAPSMGTAAVASVAMCTNTGECVANEATCIAAGQSCEDPDPAVMGDWKCNCIAPLTGSGVMMAATCAADECADNAATCSAQGQSCNDPNQDPASTGDWTCNCIAPSTGAAVQAGVAMCTNTGECIVNEATCIAAGQSCEDPDPAVMGDWKCNCIAPATGSGVMMAATCARDECVDNGATCTAQGQSCNDPNQDPASIGDWMCNCIAPSTGTAVTAGVAMCTNTGECVANEATCIAAGQSCQDPDQTVMGDWQCICIAPLAGSGLMMAATCAADECADNAATCSAQGQSCNDPNQDPASTGDWTCTCIAPSTGAAVTAGVAMCTNTGECVANEAICIAAGQSCEDPDDTMMGDWKCNCIAPSTGSGVMMAATCSLDECVDNGATCSAQGQSCNDPNPTSASTGDWTCNCIAPSTGTAVTAGVAMCTNTGECVANEATCIAMGQSCNDPNEMVMGDWQCNCIAPATGLGLQMAATCAQDECVSNAALCTAQGQSCNDPNPTPASTGDWTCNCIAPSTGTAVQAGVAMCTNTGECVANEATCIAAGQSCEDPDDTVMGDWKCNCIAPATGSGVMMAAACALDECVDNGATCTAQGQSCSDPNPTSASTGDWTCNCIAPSMGTAAVAGVAMCTNTGECVANEATCIAAGQSCEDPNPAVMGDWKCNCIAPLTGSGVMMAANCESDECIDNLATCTAQGQSCNDPNQSPKSTGDWTCNCVAPSTGTAVQAGVAMCTNTGECVANEATCIAAGQSCEDPNESIMGDWTCNCIVPMTGTAVMMAAACTLNDECIANAVICSAKGQECVDPSMSVNGDWTCNCIAPSTGMAATAIAAMCTNVGECVANEDTCHAAMQSCTDPDVMVDGNWKCNCIAPGVGSADMMAALCALDECLANAATCLVGQTCNDPDPAVTGDWTCNCDAPGTGSTTAGPASCNADECASNTCPMDQTCIDPDQAVPGDWVCQCNTPSSGTGKAAPAVCTLDECLAEGDAACNAQGQLCKDASAAVGDWTCNCIAPATGDPATAAATMCTEVGECQTNAATCHAAGQSCNDPDPAKASDWECVCITPGDGRDTAKPATCGLNECMSTGKICLENNQECLDASIDPMSLNDWTCSCVAPLTGTAKIQAASCGSGECATNSAVCTVAKQTCIDPDPTVDGDWKCVCALPTNGSALGQVASCDLDECIQNRDTCETQGQLCVDANKAEASTGDWECQCIAPASGAPVQAAPATCVQVGECKEQSVLDQCLAQKQSCNDPDEMKMGDWQCECIYPAVGDPGVAKAATCGADECYDNAATCTSVGQSCNDPDPTATGDWQCVCVSPSVGSAVNTAASCGMDECLANPKGNTCTEKGQTCEDTNQQTTGDWVCTCTGSGTGMATGAAAACMWTGECEMQYTVCEAFGQTCFDPDMAVMDDWECQCVDPQPKGSAVGKKAECGDSGLPIDECIANKATCNAAGQVCVDPNTNSTAVNDWYCECSGTGTGREIVAVVPTCKYKDGSPCATNFAVCRDGGQSCTSTDPDFTCGCVGDLFGTKANALAECSDKPITPGAGCTWEDEQSCNINDCEWSTEDNKCHPRYCGVVSCESSPICEYDIATSLCVRTRCGKFITTEECGAGENCRWDNNENSDSKIIYTGMAKPYASAPGFCTHEGDPNDNSALIGWLIIIACILCVCVAIIMYLATKLRKRLERKQAHHKLEEEKQKELLMPAKELAELNRISAHGNNIINGLQRPTQEAASLETAKKRERGAVEVSDSDTNSDDDNKKGEDETERGAALNDQLQRLKLKRAEQLIQKKQRDEAKGLERRKRQLEIEMDKDENRKETQRQVDRAKASHALQFGVAQREASKRARERGREQELLLDVEKTQSLINQQRRRRADLVENKSELQTLTAPGYDQGGELMGEDFAFQQQQDRALERLIHGREHGDFDTETVDAAPQQTSSRNVLAPPVARVRRRYEPQAVTLTTLMNNDYDEEALSDIGSDPNDDAKSGGARGLQDSSKSHVSWDVRSTMKPMGIVDKKGGPPTDYNSHYQNLVSEIVEDKLSAVETRRNLDAPAGGEVHLAPLSTSGRTEAPGTSQTTQEKAMGPAWSSLLEGVVRDSEAAGGYNAAHKSSPSLPNAPEAMGRVSRTQV